MGTGMILGKSILAFITLAYSIGYFGSAFVAVNSRLMRVFIIGCAMVAPVLVFALL